ncbi:hypothetical protein ACH5RR_023393 [Cinchona calisaya]|uniref:Uncharacterized protein n=1 Tax=Cinchona calisaya TaxID=153742 RepID=A0ABD2ZCE8_9GENT
MVTASSWLNDLRDQVEHNRVLNVIYRSATALGTRLPSIANAKARVVVAGALLRPVSSSTKVVMKRAQDVDQAVVKSRSSLPSWTCMGPRRQVDGQLELRLFLLESHKVGCLNSLQMDFLDSESPRRKEFA